MADFTSAPVVSGSTSAGWTVEPGTARRAALTVAEAAPEDLVLLLNMLGLAGQDGPEDGKWKNYMYGRASGSAGRG